MHSFKVFSQFERNHWQLKDIDFGAIRHDLVTDDYVTLAKSGVMGESNVIAAVHGFLNEFVDDYDFSTFAVVWGYQEVQHHYAFRSWLEAVGVQVDDRPVEAMREPYAPGSTPSATLVTNIISELTVNHIYRRVAGAVQEPVLSTILSNASRDEAGHAREFIHFARERLQRRPDEKQSVLETLYVYTSGTQIRHPVSIFKGGLSELADSATIDSGFDMFLEAVADKGELQELQGKIRSTVGNLVGLDLSSNARVRRALAEVMA